MTIVLNNAESKNDLFHEQIRTFLDSQGMSRAALATELGVTPITLARWESGHSRPSLLAEGKLRKLGFGFVPNSNTNVESGSLLKSRKNNSVATTHKQGFLYAGRIVMDTVDSKIHVLPSPFVRNGPTDQEAFHRKLLEMQATSNQISLNSLARRLSLIEEVEGIGTTAQHLLDRQRPTAVSWNSNYGTHGWHRYVGRFPPHVIRALLNRFGANANTVVCDPFAGSGTTAVECRLLGIPFVGIEICPLSCMMIRTKAAFPAEPQILVDVARSFISFYNKHWNGFLKGRKISSITHKDILNKKGNLIPEFANIERWFTPEALLGVSIAVEFGMSLDGFSRDAIFLALSSKMRSIGNVDVDVVRAEYRKQPRENVEVGRLVARQLHKMAADIKNSLSSHFDLIGPSSGVTLHEDSVLDVDLPEASIDYVITSPPYGVEAISYLRTHLLSYRSLYTFFGHDPYDTRDKTIGSEYITDPTPKSKHRAGSVSPTCRKFFSITKNGSDSKYQARRAAMKQFCDDMLAVGEKLSKWLKDDGQLAFIIGNKKLGDDIIPMDVIIVELFDHCGLTFVEAIRHKLKTNNSNSQVPWQERIIQEEAILLFKKLRR